MTPEQLAKSGSEHAEQRALMAWANHMVAKHHWPFLDLLHAIPNAGARGNKVAAAQLKAEGVKAGVPDLFLPCPSRHSGGPYVGLYIEMKRRKLDASSKAARGTAKGRVSDLQSDFMKSVTKYGYKCSTCFGWKEAALVLCRYAYGRDDISLSSDPFPLPILGRNEP